MTGVILAIGFTILIIVFALYINSRKGIKRVTNQTTPENIGERKGNFEKLNEKRDELFANTQELENQDSNSEINSCTLDQQQEIQINKNIKRYPPKDILEGVDIDKYINDIARKLLYSEYGYGEYTAECLNDIDLNEKDALFNEAARLIVVHQSGSTSLIQRKFGIGYNRAGRLMDQLEKAGIVGPAQGSTPRKVYIMNEHSLDLKLLSIEKESSYDNIIDAVEERYYEKIQNRKEYLLNNYKQEEELERLQKIDKEKEEIRKRLLEKERKKQLEKQIRQDLIDEGLIEE